MSPESKDLISRLLKTNPKERIGANVLSSYELLSMIGVLRN